MLNIRWLLAVIVVVLQAYWTSWHITLHMFCSSGRWCRVTKFYTWRLKQYSPDCCPFPDWTSQSTHLHEVSLATVLSVSIIYFNTPFALITWSISTIVWCKDSYGDSPAHWYTTASSFLHFSNELPSPIFSVHALLPTWSSLLICLPLENLNCCNWCLDRLSYCERLPKRNA